MGSSRPSRPRGEAVTVAELIAALQEFPGDRVVYYWDDDIGRWVPAQECYNLSARSEALDGHVIISGVGIRGDNIA